MASFELNVDDSSPLIVYSPAGAWNDSPTTDPLIASYSGQSSHVTNTRGAAATIKFVGTGIQIIGGKRPGYGGYSMTIDGQVNTDSSAASTTPSLNQVLAEAEELENGPHTVIFTNTGTGTIVDIDRIVVLTQAGADGATLTNSTIDDNDPRINYSPPAEWSPSSDPSFGSGTLHFTNASDAQASFQFSGDAVAIYGSVSPQHADIQITLDGAAQTIPLADGNRVSNLRTQTLLFYATNLDSQPHSLVMQPVAGGPGPFCDLDAIVVYSATGGTTAPIGLPPTGGSTPTPNTQTIGSKSNNTALIAGVAVVCGIVVIAVIIVTLFVLRRRRNRNRSPITPITPALPFQYNKNMAEGGFSNVPITPSKYRPPVSSPISLNSTTGLIQPSMQPAPDAIPELTPRRLPPLPPPAPPSRPVRRAPTLRLDP